jgi:hypothetical protein
MLKLPTTYEDYNGVTHTEDFYFNITKPELIELEVEYKMGFQEHLQAIIETEDRKQLIAEFKRILTMTYGQKTPDGKRFIKNDELTEAFTQHPAYPVIYMLLATDYNYAADFIAGIVPKDMSGDVRKELDNQTRGGEDLAPLQSVPVQPPPPPAL